MNRNRLLSIGLLSALFLGLASLRGQEPIAAPKSSSDQVRSEIEALESRVRRLETELDEARAAAVLAKIQADVFEFRCKKLQEELDSVRPDRPATGGRHVPKVELAVRTKAVPAIAQGKITSIAKDGRMLQLSIGLDSGIKEGQTLEVFRLPANDSAKPVYLGTVTLLRVDLQAALGEFKTATGADHRPKVGDDVASEFVVK